MNPSVTIVLDRDLLVLRNNIFFENSIITVHASSKLLTGLYSNDTYIIRLL